MDETKDILDSSKLYSSMKEDSEYLFSLLDKYVKVELIKNTLFKGFVHSIDPITKSTILSIPNKEMYQTTLIPGHAILDITEESPPDNATPPARRETVKITDEEILLNKNKLIAWLKKNLLPVTEEDQSIRVGSVNILPPFNSSSICADNPVVALQVKNIIEKMPDNFTP